MQDLPRETAARSTATPVSRERLKSALGVALAILVSVAMFVLMNRYKDELIALSGAGYLGLFLVNILGNATLVFPVPVAMVSCAAASAFNPILIGLVAGAGATLGELTGYIAGVNGKGLIPQGAMYQRLEYFVRKHGMLTLGVLAAVPNPLFDIGGIIAGGLRMPVWKFLTAAWVGKSLRLFVTAEICLYGANWLSRWLPFLN
jgi:membrane protein YqaA with SNARE-associated domain